MGKTIYICESDLQLNKNSYLVVFWQSFETGDDRISIPALVEKNADKFKSKYLAWLYQLGRSRMEGGTPVDCMMVRPDFSAWWMSLLIEKSQWKSRKLYDVFRLMALDTIFEQHQDISKIEINIGQREIQDILEKWATNKNIAFKSWNKKEDKQNETIRDLFKKMPGVCQALFSYINYLLVRWPFRQTGSVKETNDSIRRISFIAPFFNLDPENLKKGVFCTRYWTKLHEVLDENVSHLKITWQHLFLKSPQIPDAKKALSYLKRLNNGPQTNQTHIFFESCLGFRLAGKVLRDYLKLWFSSKRLRKPHRFFRFKGSELNFWPLFKDDWNSSVSGTTALTNCFYLNLFEMTLNHIPKQDRGFYILENQNWERALIYTWKKANHGRLTGVQHTMVKFWDLRHFFAPEEYDNGECGLPLPDLIALNGDAAVKAYKDGGFPSDRITTAEALRFLYTGGFSDPDDKLAHADGKRLLVLGDINPEVTHRQLNLLSGALSQSIDDLTIMFKPHPACCVDIDHWPELDVKQINTPLDVLLNEYDIAFTSNSTTSAADAYLCCKQVIVMLEKHTFNMSPLRGIKEAVFVSTPVELYNVLAGTCEVPNSYVNNFFRTDPNLPEWRAMLFEQVERNTSKMHGVRIG